MNSAAGPLIVDPTYGTAVIDGDSRGATATVAWRPGFTGRRVGSEIQVLDPDGHVVATTGSSYRMAGAYVADDWGWPQLPKPVFWACGSVTQQP